MLPAACAAKQRQPMPGEQRWGSLGWKVAITSNKFATRLPVGIGAAFCSPQRAKCPRSQGQLTRGALWELGPMALTPSPVCVCFNRV